MASPEDNQTASDVFWMEYYLQTRREIDTEKQERDKLLHFIILVLGAVSFSVAQSTEAQRFLQHPKGLAVTLPAMVIISSLFWVRRKKLQQIADRWHVLQDLLAGHCSSEHLGSSLEAAAMTGFAERRYVLKDAVLNGALSLAIYPLVFFQLDAGLKLLSTVIIFLLIVIVHGGSTTWLLYRRLRSPFNED